MEKHILLYHCFKNIVITVFQNDWFPLMSYVLSFVRLKVLFRLPGEEGGREEGGREEGLWHTKKCKNIVLKV